MTKFCDFWPKQFKLINQGTEITPDRWPRIIKRAGADGGVLKLDFQLSENRKSTLKGILLDRAGFVEKDSKIVADAGQVVEDNGTDANTIPCHSNKDVEVPVIQSQPSLSDGFFVFSWSSMIATGAKQTYWNSQAQLEQDLRAIDHFLRQQTNLEDRLAYNDCQSSSWNEVYSTLKKEANEISGMPIQKRSRSDEKRRDRHERKVDFFNSMQSIFEFYLPLSSEGPTIEKFWGAVATLLKVVDAGSELDDHNRKSRRGRHTLNVFDEDDIQSICSRMNDLLYQTQPLKELLSQSPLEDRFKVKIPNQLVQAWLRILMSLIIAARNSEGWYDHIRAAETLIKKGSHLLVRSLATRRLSKYSVVMPREIVSLMSLNLVNDMEENDVQQSTVQTYSEYCRKLEHEMTADPTNRFHQGRIVSVNQELFSIDETLELQRQICTSISQGQKEGDIVKKHFNRNHRYRDFATVHSQDVGSRHYSYAPSHGAEMPTRDAPGYHHPSPYTAQYSQTGYSPHNPYNQSSVYPGYPYGTTQHAHQFATTPRDNTIAGIASEPSENPSKLLPTDPEGYRDLFVQECLDMIRVRRGGFLELRQKLADLARQSTLLVETKKDKQDAAIYVFTIVTVIFLPLGTVASILGMNTSDIRNMNSNQWVFWAVAIPLSAIVISVCMIATGQLKSLWELLVPRLRRTHGTAVGWSPRQPLYPVQWDPRYGSMVPAYPPGAMVPNVPGVYPFGPIETPK